MIQALDPIAVGLLALRVAVVLALYAMLFSALRILRAELRGGASKIAAPVGDRLEIVACDDGADLVGRLYPLASESGVGRAAGNAVTIPDPRVSAQHARLTWRGGSWWVEDLGSVNGTFVNEERVVARSLVGYEDVMRFGPACARLRERAQQ